MSYHKEQEDLVIDGFDKGIAIGPLKGVANLQGVNIATENGEVMCSFNRVNQAQVGTTGTITRVNTNTVSISGITLLVGQVITIVSGGTTGLSGNYYYLSTGKLYAGSLPPNDPDNAVAVTGINAGTATFSITYPLGSPIQSATESYYKDLTTTQYFRYYILDSLGQVWCRDTNTLVNWDTPLWFFVGAQGAGASGLAVYNGWLTIQYSTTTYWKLTSLLGRAWLNNGSLYQGLSFHNTLTGKQGRLYGTDGDAVMSLFADTSLITGAANVQSYGQYSSALGSNIVTNGTFTGSATGWTLGAAWLYNSNAVDKNADGTNVLSQDIGASGTTLYKLTFTISNYTTGTVTPDINGNTGSAVSANGTYTQFIYTLTGGPSNLTFTPTNTSRFTIDTITVTAVNTSITAIIGGSLPTTGSTSPRIPALFFTNGTLPTSIVTGTIYYIQWFLTRMEVFTAITGGSALDLSTGAVGKQYFNTFDATTSAGSSMLTYTAQRLTLPFYETATVLAEIGNTVLVGTKSNAVYPWNQVSGIPQDILFLPENNTAKLITVNNMGYIFAGNKGNIYITSGSSISAVISVPDYCAGIAGTPSTYIEPYFTWGDAMYCRGRVYFSILDQTATKAGNCGGVWSFIPTQNSFIQQDQGLALRIENKNSYGTYNGLATVLIPSFNQAAIGTQYWSGWYSSVSAPTYGIDFTDTIPQVAVIETDLIPTGTMLGLRTFQQIEYKLSSPLVSGDSLAIAYRQNSTDAFTSCGAPETFSVTELSGYFLANFQNGQWLQLQITLTPLASSSSSFIRLTEIRIR